jgi:hypothetical protein
MIRKKAIVLMVTLMTLLALLGIVTIFLTKTSDAVNTVRYEKAVIQTNAIVKNLEAYLKAIPMDQEMIFMAAKVPLPLELGDSIVTFIIESNQNKPNLNALIQESISNSITMDNFINLLYSYEVRNPKRFTYILQDTIDKDDKERGSYTEIIKDNPFFRNEKLYNFDHLKSVMDYYNKSESDESIYKVPFKEYFSFRKGSNLDLNHMDFKTLKFVFDDANEYTLEAIAAHKTMYEKFDDLPFDTNYKKDLKKNGKMGQTISVSTTELLVTVMVDYKEQFSSEVSFIFDGATKKITDYTIDSIQIISDSI